MNPTMNPAYLIRAYAWKILKTNMGDVWDESKYDGLIPIVEVAEDPELEGLSGPHIIYGYAVASSGIFYPHNRGSVTFAVYDDNFRRLTKTMNILQAAFERQDDTARDINNFTTNFTTSLDLDNNPRKPFVGMRFGSVWVGFTEGGTPETSEGGRQSALINISFNYFVDYDVITTV
jgi:hypothetical protein